MFIREKMHASLQAPITCQRMVPCELTLTGGEINGYRLTKSFRLNLKREGFTVP